MDPQQLFARLTALSSSMTGKQLASLAGAFLLVVGIVGGSAYWLNKPTYALLFADMEAEDAGQMVTRIKALKVPYQLDPGGRSIRVPAERVDELRLELSAQGMPNSGRVGFEIFDRTAFGATEFLEQVNYRRALEGEIARTIGSISEVSSARVHIAMGRDTLFGDPRPAKASVVLKLRGSRGLAPSTISGITNLVAASVEGLRPEAVVVVDSFGRPLAKPGEEDNDPLGAAQLEKQARIEKEMSSRVVALLEPVVGIERVRVNVAVKLNPQSQEETEERWDPNTVLRSRQTTSDTQVAGSGSSVAGGGGGGAAGAGSRANLPASAAAASAAAAATSTVTNTTGPSATRTAETSNFEVSKTTRRTIMPPGDIQRLSVAVILDDDQQVTTAQDGTVSTKRVPRTPEDLTKIQGLVAASVGLEMDRGDQLTVQNVSFEEAAPEVPEAPRTVVQRVQEYTPQIWEGVRMVIVLVIAVVALLFVVKPMLSGAAAMAATGGAAGAAMATAGSGRAPVLPPGQPLRTVADMESEMEARLEAAAAEGAEGRRLPVLTKRVTAISDSEPENVAKLLRGWIAEGER